MKSVLYFCLASIAIRLEHKAKCVAIYAAYWRKIATMRAVFASKIPLEEKLEILAIASK